ncbi:MAG TPA: ATP-dependent DNA helicase RecG [Ruminococcaceae bacterium]|nr:ATP-dependent DNA helicase RecG [Oscillospiraceae bacterium]
MVDFSSNVQYLKGVGEARARLFRRLGVETVGDLLRLYPRAYEDWSQTVKISQANPGEACCVKAMVASRVSKAMIRKGMTVFKCDVTDGESMMRVTIFNNRFAAEKLQEGETFLFFGRMNANAYSCEMLSPQIERATTGERIRPIYPQTQSLTSRTIEACVKRALEELTELPEDVLDESIRKQYDLCDYAAALQGIHFPKNHSMMLRARRRLCFEELYVLQAGMMLLRSRNRRLAGYRLKTDETDRFLDGLPFTPTNAQKRAVAECVADMMGEMPMSRLLQGDVGSGKTAVAAALAFCCAENGTQTAVMAPTEILAIQHYKTFSSLLQGTGLRVALLVGSTPAAEKKKLKKEIAEGEVSIVIGTHALIQKDVLFRSLALVITDEQHRFGVGQRNELGAKGRNPHTLVMSATPIPRTLALMIYGDLDVSVLDELPAGRQKIETYAIGSDKRQRAYAYVKKHLDEGRQGYIVCPLVEDGEIPELTAATTYAEELANNEFCGYTVGLLHGKMKPKEKEQVMAAFSAGDIQLLVSTTVIEVGIDVPNAVIMVIENADRFGLSQLHQLRGRVGRGQFLSTCILISDAKGDIAKQRLKIMCKTTDGFRIADEDLQLRGPGDFFGSRQHGLPEMKIADLSQDMDLLKKAQAAAKQTLSEDSALRATKNAALKAAVLKLFDSVGPYGMN